MEPKNPAAVGAQDGDVLTGLDGNAEAVEGEASASFDENVTKFE